MKKIFWILAKVTSSLSSIIAVLFTVYITNADSKIIEVIYDFMQKYHDQKDNKDLI